MDLSVELAARTLARLTIVLSWLIVARVHVGAAAALALLCWSAQLDPRTLLATARESGAWLSVLGVGALATGAAWLKLCQFAARRWLYAYLSQPAKELSALRRM
jgi:hypothetical protein